VGVRQLGKDITSTVSSYTECSLLGQHLTSRAVSTSKTQTLSDCPWAESSRHFSLTSVAGQVFYENISLVSNRKREGSHGLNICCRARQALLI
jgi:hypothetical protein